MSFDGGAAMTDRIAIAEEANSLPIHVQMCALRHQQLLAEISHLRRLVGAIFLASLTAAGGSLAPFAPQLLGVLRAVAGQ
jgi:hypothetical protein